MLESGTKAPDFELLRVARSGTNMPATASCYVCHARTGGSPVSSQAFVILAQLNLRHESFVIISL